MKSKKILSLFISFLTMTSLVGCNKDDASDLADNGTITVWVGAESVAYYQDVLNKYRENNQFPYTFEVVASDAGKAAQNFRDDPEKAADIITVAHDNLAKLTAGSSLILPVTDENLKNQIKNETIFEDVVTQTIKTNKGDVDYIFAAPYVTQSLFLLYNKAVVSETQVQTWEGLRDAARAAQQASNHEVKAVTHMGGDNFNFSWSILARNAATGETSLKLYENKKAENCYFQGDDMVAISKFVQDYFADANGAIYPESVDWATSLTPVRGSNVGTAVAVVGGAWIISQAKQVLGDNLGVAKLPTFTTTADMGTVKAGTKFQSGTFYDCKAFVMKKASPYAQYLQDIVKYLTSKEIQVGSFKNCNNLPAYKNALTDADFGIANGTSFEAKVARIQYEMGTYGIPQPFGTGEKFNSYYYDSGAADQYKNLVENNKNIFGTYQLIKDQLRNIEHIWKTGTSIQ